MKHLACLTVAALATASAFTHNAQAQPPAPAAPTLQPMADPMDYRWLRVQNISPVLLAWRIDPEHNPRPAVPPELEGADKFPPEKIAAGAPAKPPSILPEGIQMITAVQPRTGLLAYGTAAGMEQLRKLVDSLDKPVQYVEIDSKIIEVGPEDLAGFGIDFNSSNGPFSFSTAGVHPAATTGAVSMGYSRENWQVKLDGLLAAHKAKVLLDSQITTVSNRKVDAHGSYSCVEPGAQQSFPGYVTVNDTLAMTPMLNEDHNLNNEHTISLALHIKHTRQFFDDASGPTVLNSSEISTSATIKDGDTIILGGLRDGVNVAENKLPAGAQRPGDRDLLVFVTAHIVKPEP